jgi:hypothetical protein
VLLVSERVGELFAVIGPKFEIRVVRIKDGIVASAPVLAWSARSGSWGFIADREGVRHGGCWQTVVGNGDGSAFMRAERWAGRRRSCSKTLSVGIDRESSRGFVHRRSGAFDWKGSIVFLCISCRETGGQLDLLRRAPN